MGLSLEYHLRMKSNAKPNSEFENFDSAMRRVLLVSKAELQRRIDAQNLANQGKPKRGPKPKASASGRVSGEKG